MAYKHIEDRRAYHREYMRQRRAMHRAYHLCTECKKQDAYTLAGHPRCFEHTHYRHKSPMEYISEPVSVLPAYREDGTCCRCGAPVKEGVTAWGGEPYRLCERCYDNTVKAGRAGREKYREVHGETWGQMQYRYLKAKR